MKRRECITLFGGAALTWPLTAGMQRIVMPAVGLLTVANLPEWAKKSICTGLAEAEYVDGRNLTIISRSAEGLVSRASPVHAAMRNCTGDEGGPFGVGNQVLISSHRKLLRSKAVVVNVAETSGQDSGRHGRERRA
jgi:hypothetical protein